MEYFFIILNVIYYYKHRLYDKVSQKYKKCLKTSKKNNKIFVLIGKAIEM